MDALIRNGGVDASRYEAYPGAIFGNPTNRRFDQELLSISPLGYPGVARTPILFYHSTNDELAPIAKMRELAARYCAEGVTVHVITSPAGDHIAYVLTGFPTGLNYIADRFAGQSAPNDCQAPRHAPGCPLATGKLRGRTLGLARLGMTRRQARHAYTRSSTRGFKYKDFFCLTPHGVRVGYASPALLKTLRARERRRFKGRVVWISTSNSFYDIHGVRPGATISAARRHLKLSGPFRVGLNRWYLAPHGASTAVLKVRHGVVEEIGIGENALTGRSRRTRFAFLRSFS
jgi:hypothetical protein